jgi:sister chromatid cohesion protein PDS5
MMTFLRRASLRLVNQSSIPFLLRHLERGDPTGDGYGTSQAQLSANNAQAILTSVSKYCPIIYKAHVGELNKAIADEKNPRLVGVCLQALAALAKWDDGLVFADKYDLISSFPTQLCRLIHGRRTTERVLRFALDSNPRLAKYSARLLAVSANKEECCMEMVNVCSPPPWYSSY